MKATRAVVVTTEFKGVFFGYVQEDESLDQTTIRIERARMCVFWAASVRGVVGLAASGPNNECKITSAIPAVTLQKVTSIMECGSEAKKKWEAQPWN